jgi:calpain
MTTSAEERAKFGMSIDHDGEFWMSYDDFLMRFDKLNICTNRTPSDQGISWKCTEFNGAWIQGKTAGGCLMNKQTFHLNPQFVVNLDTPDSNDPSGRCSFFLSLSQKNRPIQNSKRNYVSLGYAIYKLDQFKPDQEPIGEMFFRFAHPVEYTSSFSPSRGITGRHKLPPGTYLIVPSPFSNTTEAEFILRVYSETIKEVIPEEVDENEEESPQISEKKKESTKRDDLTVDDSEVIDDPEWDDVERLFKNAAGKKEAIDWVELKKILDTTIPQGK